MKPSVVVLASCLVSFVSALWPIPSQYTSGTSVLWIDENVKFDYNCNAKVGYMRTEWQRFMADIFEKKEDNPLAYSNDQDIVNLAVQRAFVTIFQQNFVPWKFNPRNSNFEPAPENQQYISSITLQQNDHYVPNGTQWAAPVEESYTISVPLSGEVTITANSSIGLSYGLTTFSQLFFQHTQSGVYTKLAPVEITDSPMFQHRGLNMDTARNYFPVTKIKQTLDAMAFTKMNRLHWHITDAQSWPLVIPALPELSNAGAYAPGLVYSPYDVADVMQYGNLLGIETAVEIDMPGHTSSIHFSHPDLITSFNTQPYSNNCAEPPCGSLKLNSSAVYSFLDTVFDDLFPRIAQYSSFFHSGGDEVNVNAYLLDDTVRSNDTAVLQPLMQKFIDYVHGKIHAAGLTPIVWEEMVLDWNISMSKDVLVNCWLSDESVAEVTAKGYRAIVGNYNNWVSPFPTQSAPSIYISVHTFPFLHTNTITSFSISIPCSNHPLTSTPKQYLDCGQGQWLNFYPNTSASFYPWNDYCSPRKNWRLVYSLDPLSGVPANQTHLVAGGEVHLWAEQIDEVNFDKQAWPRAAAAAEVLWSGAKDPVTGGNRSQIDAAPRLSEFRERLVARGVGAETIQMPFCTQNGTQCYV